jgi:hypothetical protein
MKKLLFIILLFNVFSSNAYLINVTNNSAYAVKVELRLISSACTGSYLYSTIDMIAASGSSSFNVTSSNIPHLVHVYEYANETNNNYKTWGRYFLRFLRRWRRKFYYNMDFWRYVQHCDRLN